MMMKEIKKEDNKIIKQWTIKDTHYSQFRCGCVWQDTDWYWPGGLIGSKDCKMYWLNPDCKADHPK